MNPPSPSSAGVAARADAAHELSPHADAPDGAIIELVHVCRHYRAAGVRAVDDVSLTVRRGEFLAIVGPSGSGKTTLLNLMCGLDRPTSGIVRFDGRQPAGVRDWARCRARDIGFVFQAFHLLPSLSALENVEIPMFGTGVGRAGRTARSRGLLEGVGLAACAARRPGELSSGEKQRAAIARSLANSPRVVLADEPTGNLDSRNAAAVLDLLLRLVRGRGIALVVVTHNADLAREADRTVAFADGRIVRVDERRAQP